MKYQIRADRATITYGITTLVVEAKSEEEALRLAREGHGELVDSFDNESESAYTTHAVMFEIK